MQFRSSDTTTTSRESLPDQPKRGADRNQCALTNEAGQPTEAVLLPSLDAGVTVLDIQGGRGVPIVHALVLDHLLMRNGPAFWVDTNGYATTTTLARLTPSHRLLARIHVARGFTAYQHYGAVCDLPTAIERYLVTAADTDAEHRDHAHHSSAPDAHQSSTTPSLIVAPTLDGQYRADDTLGGDHAEALQARALARLAASAQKYDATVLLTRTDTDAFTAAIERAADHHLRCEQTSMGPRFVGDEFETVVYPVADGAYYQTTFSYWRRVLSVRADLIGRQPAPTPTSSAGAADATMASADSAGSVEDHGTTGGTDASPTPDPLLDAWTARGPVGGGGR